MLVFILESCIQVELLPILLTRNAREPSASDLLVLHDLVGTAELSLHFPADHASYTNFAATVSSTAIPEIEWDLAQKGTGGQQKVAAPSWQPHRCAPSRCHHSLLTILQEADVSVNTTGGAPETPAAAAHRTLQPTSTAALPTGCRCSVPSRHVQSARSSDSTTQPQLHPRALHSHWMMLKREAYFSHSVLLSYHLLLPSPDGQITRQLPQPLSSLPVCSPTRGRAPPAGCALLGLPLPRDLKTVVFSGSAGFVPFSTSPSSAKISACKTDVFTAV